MVKVPVWIKILCVGVFLVFGCSFIAMDLLGQQKQTDSFNCTDPQGTQHYGEPISNKETSTDISGTINYHENQTFSIHIENPNNKRIELASHPSISPVKDDLMDNETFVSTESEINYRYQIKTNGVFRQSRVFEEFDGTGYFPIPKTSPTIEYSIPNGEQIGTNFGMSGANIEVTTEERDCHTVVVMNHGRTGSSIAFNEMKESMGHLEYEQPYAYTYMFLVEYDISPNQSESFIGKAYEHNSWIESTNVHSAEQNVIYHEYIHTRQYAHFKDNMNYGRNGMSESFAVYNDIKTRQESNQISKDMEAGLFALRNRDSDTPYEGEDAYLAGSALLYTLDQKYDIDIQQVETSCDGNYTETCFTEQIRTQNESAATFFTNEIGNYSTSNNSPETSMRGWLQLIIYSQYTTVLRVGIITLSVVWFLFKIRKVLWQQDKEL